MEVQRLADARVAGGHAKLLPLHREGYVTDEALQTGVSWSSSVCKEGQDASSASRSASS